MKPSALLSVVVATAACGGHEPAPERPSTLGAPSTATTYTTSATGEPRSGDAKSGTGGLDGKVETGMWIAGISYGASIAVGQVWKAIYLDHGLYQAIGSDTAVDQLWLPVIGPFQAIGTLSDSEEICPSFDDQYPEYCNPTSFAAGTGLALAAGIAQAIGVGMITWGLLDSRGGGGDPSSPTDRVIMSATPLPGGGALGVAGSF